jgi:hypothetical protein
MLLLAVANFCFSSDPSLDDVNVLADSSYYEEINHHELPRVEGIWGEEHEMGSDEEIGDGVDVDDDVIRSDDNDD